MKFIDEVTIHVQAGKGGYGCCSFRREKFIRFGGPDGGNGGNGGNIYLKASSRLHTLIDLNYKKSYQSESGKPGRGSLCFGKSGEDLIIEVPIGTIVKEQDTNEIIGDLVNEQQLLLIAKGGHGGLGNHVFKSSTNRAPRKFTKGSLGEEHNLHLELRLLADVGLVGLPNAGKSLLISKVSSARPKVADYPFTTLKPHLGVIKVDQTSFVMADIPGLLEGASSGIGLGIRFLKHLSRTALLLHMVDLAICLNSNDDENFYNKNVSQQDAILLSNVIKQINLINKELENYHNSNLTAKPRWLVINKVDLLTKEQLNRLSKKLIKLNKNNKLFLISAVDGTGIKQMCQEIVKYLETQRTQII